MVVAHPVEGVAITGFARTARPGGIVPGQHGRGESRNATLPYHGGRGMAAGPTLKNEMFAVEWVSVASSNVAAVAYSGADFQRLWVRFHSGSVYVYHSVPESVYAGLMAAGSKGGYLAKHVKGHFGYTRTA